MISHETEGGGEETSDTRRVSTIRGDDDVSIRLDGVGVRRCISRVGGWIGISFVIQHVNTGATSVGDVCV